MFRIKSFVAFAFFVALSSMVGLAQSSQSSSTQQKLNHKLKITTNYNKSSDTTAVRFLLKQPNRLATLATGSNFGGADPAFGEDVAISAFFSHPGRQISQAVDEATIWVAYTGGPRTAVTSKLSAMVDGREIVLNRQVETAPRPDRQGANVRSLFLSVGRDQLIQMANGSEVVLVLPSGERIALTRQQLNAMVDFTNRMHP